MNLVYLYQMFPTKSKRMVFLAKCSLTFGLRLDALSELLKMDKDELLKEIILYNQALRESLFLVFRHGMKLQDQAKNEFIEYFNQLCTFSVNKDMEKAKELLGVINDKDVIALRGKKRKEKLSDEDVLTILKFQLKYMLDTTTIGKIFEIDRKSYARRVRNLDEKYTNLISDFDYLSDFYVAYNFDAKHRMRH